MGDIDMHGQEQSSGYPSSYDDDVFSSDGLAGLAGLGALPDGYVGFATVTTNDPAPAGDLKIHAGPSASSPQIGGADKGSPVAVRGDMPAAPGWAYVENTSGPSFRNAQVKGYAALAYLSPLSDTPTPVPPVIPVPGLPNLPAPPPGDVPAEDSSTLFYVAAGAAAIVLGGAAYFLLRKRA